MGMAGSGLINRGLSLLDYFDPAYPAGLSGDGSSGQCYLCVRGPMAFILIGPWEAKKFLAY